MHKRPFSPTDQAAAKQLILAGLAEHWGELDLSLNPDLNDIQASYVDKGGVFIVVEAENGKLIGTGALLPEGENAARILRVSVHQDYRRMGLGRALTAELIEAAHHAGYAKILVETTETWEPAIRLYQDFGFTEVDRYGGDVHMELVM
ncbi:MAG: GNAT family N-acetyltransferase [Anaerolineae bacterium]|nr:GNAT family N-acetyltransferase [Anaerolineae bacterium]